MDETKKYHLTVWAIAGILSIAAFLTVLFIKQDYSVKGWCDVTFLSGGIVLMLFLLYLVVHLGAFDIFNYGFRDLFYHMNPNKDKTRKYRDYPDFIEQQKKKRLAHKVYFLPFLVICGALLACAIVLRLVYQAQLSDEVSASQSAILLFKALI